MTRFVRLCYWFDTTIYAKDLTMMKPTNQITGPTMKSYAASISPSLIARASAIEYVKDIKEMQERYQERYNTILTASAVIDHIEDILDMVHPEPQTTDVHLGWDDYTLMSTDE